MKKLNFLRNMGLIALILAVSTGMSHGQEKKEETLKIKTSAVCNMCKERIESNLPFEKGVRDVKLDVKSKMLTVVYKPSKTNPDKIRAAVNKIGYDADDKPADMKAYEKLPACCKKDMPVHD